MVSGSELPKINKHLQYCFPARSTEPYGGANVIFLGDFFQLTPIGGKPLFKLTDEVQKHLWIRKEDAVVILTQQMRHTSSSTNNYADINAAARDASLTKSDIRLLNTRVLSNPRGEPYDLIQFADRIPVGVPVAAFTNGEVESINTHKLIASGNPIVNCWARHHFSSKSGQKLNNASCLTSSTHNLKLTLEACVSISVGSPVMLIKNLATELGLVNGSIGIVFDIMYDTTLRDGPINPQASLEDACAANPMLAQPVVLVRFPTYRGASFITTEEKIVPICPVQETTKNGASWSRAQLPLRVAYAMTIHKVQGMTLPGIALDLSRAKQRGLAYVGISRVKTLDALMLRLPLTQRNFTGAAPNEPESTKHNDFSYITIEYQRLTQIYTATVRKYQQLFNSIPIL